MTDHIDKLYYCQCRCGCTDVVASDFHPCCTFCRMLHKDKYPDGQLTQQRRSITLE